MKAIAQGEPNKRGFTYLMLGGMRVAIATSGRVALLKLLGTFVCACVGACLRLCERVGGCVHFGVRVGVRVVNALYTLLELVVT